MSFPSKEDIFAILESLPSIRGASSDDIRRVELELGVTFPVPYRRYLVAAGEIGPARSELFELGRLSEKRKEWLASAEEDGVLIPQRDNAIFFDETDMFSSYFFIADGSDDPTVFAYNYYNGDETPDAQTRLSDFLALRLKDSLGI